MIHELGSLPSREDRPARVQFVDQLPGQPDQLDVWALAWIEEWRSGERGPACEFIADAAPPVVQLLVVLANASGATSSCWVGGRRGTGRGIRLGERDEPRLMVATKMGRRAHPHVADAYTLEAFRDGIDRSRRNLGVDTVDLVQLHCPPTPVFGDDRVYDALDTLVAEGRIGAYGMSVETVDKALTAIPRPGLASVQIILNVFRRKPLEQVLPAARQHGVGVIARVPLASGLLSGKYDEDTRFARDDHRSHNRHGEAFDVGETFRGVPYEVGVAQHAK